MPIFGNRCCTRWSASADIGCCSRALSVWTVLSLFLVNDEVAAELKKEIGIEPRQLWWGVTHSQRFKAAVAGAGIANWNSYYGQNGIDQWMIPFFGASAYDDPAIYRAASPIESGGRCRGSTFRCRRSSVRKSASMNEPARRY